MISIQQRAASVNNRNFTFNECHPNCHCNKDLCLNSLMESSNKHKWKVLIKRINKCAEYDDCKRDTVMWGLFALEPIPAGAYVVEYTGEVLTAKDGDMRGKFYDEIGMSYLFDMNDPE